MNRRNSLRIAVAAVAWVLASAAGAQEPLKIGFVYVSPIGRRRNQPVPETAR